MTETRWTEGKWRVDADVPPLSVEAEDGQVICRVLCSHDFPRLEGEEVDAMDEEADANAALIAAAPTLYEALSALMDNLGAASLAKNAYGEKLLQDARAALAAARGEGRQP